MREWAFQLIAALVHGFARISISGLEAKIRSSAA